MINQIKSAIMYTVTKLALLKNDPLTLMYELYFDSQLNEHASYMQLMQCGQSGWLYESFRSTAYRIHWF